MGKIFYIMGKSASGKDTIYNRVLKNKELKLKKLIIYTTRPMRMGEIDGEDYYFASEEVLERMRGEGRIIEERSYETVNGRWTYFTANDVELSKNDYIGVGTLDSYRKLCDYFGVGSCIDIYIETDDFIRLNRAINREKEQEFPNYSEVCRRYLADEADFSKANLSGAGIRRHFCNDNSAEECTQEIIKYISSRQKTG